MIRQERALQFLELLKEGKTYREIGKLFKLSQTMVYLDLKTYYKKETRKVLKDRPRKRSSKDFITITCKECGKKEKTKYKHYEKQYCSRECMVKHYRKVWQKM
jgi:transposase